MASMAARGLTWGLVVLGAFVVGCDDANDPANLSRDAAVSSVRDAGAVSNLDGGGAQDAGAEYRDGSVARDAGTPVDQCDPVAQTGCSPPATKCVVEGPNTAAGTRCVTPGPNESAFEEECMGRECEAGLACVRESSTSTTSRCAQVCDVATAVGCESLGPDYDCNTRISGSNWGACTKLPPLCNPYDQDTCAVAEACQPWVRRDGTWEFRCRERGTGQEGALCTSGNPRCDRGLACVRATDGTAFCRKYCETNDDCVAPAQCAGNVANPPFMYCAE